MKRAFIITLLIGFTLWLAGCEVVETHYVGHGRRFHAPPPVIVHSRPVYSPPRYRPGRPGRGSGHGPGRGHERGW